MDNKRIAIFLGHPAHFHLYKNVIINLEKDGYKVDILLKRKDILEQLVIDEGWNYYVVRDHERTDNSKIGLINSLLSLDWKVLKYLNKYSPKLLTGTYSAVLSKLRAIPIVVCNEDDAAVVKRFAMLSYPSASAILVPRVCDCGKWESKAIKYESYHELAYLHPNNFTPNKKIVEQYFSADSPFFIMRFAKLNAHHDSGIKGIDNTLTRKIIDKLKPYGRIYITSERELDPEFEQYRMHINPLDMHHVMAFAELYIGDSQTMAAEAGVLGVPFIRFNGFVGRIGYLRELEDVYHLGFGIQPDNPEMLLTTIDILLQMQDRKAVFQQRRQKMLSEKIDYSKFLTWFLENYPESKRIMKNNPDYQYNFR